MRRDQPGGVGDHQQDEQGDGQGNPHGERLHRAWIVSPVANQEKQPGTQTGEDQEQHDGDDNFDQHKWIPGVRGKDGCWKYN